MSLGYSQGSVLVDRYRLESKLGEGGMGAVWSAVHLVTGKRVAIKFLKADLAGNASIVSRFIREARAACAVRHPNVVAIHDVLQTPAGVPFMVMDLLQGESLGERLAHDGKLPLAEVARIMLAVVSAIEAAHAASVVHRDLKPDNLFLVPLGSNRVDVRVLDFGIAKVTSTDEPIDPLTKTGSMVGTPYYMSPEQLFGEKDVDYRTDIWALGIILYECLSGKRPTEADNLGQIIKLVTATGIPPLSTIAVDVPADVSDLVRRMLTQQRDVRPTLAEVTEVLARYTDAATTTQSASRAPHVVIASSNPAALASTDGEWAATQPDIPRTQRRWYAIPAVAAIALGVGGGVFAMQQRRSLDAPSPSDVAGTSASPPPPASSTVPQPAISADAGPPTISSAPEATPSASAPASANRGGRPRTTPSASAQPDPSAKPAPPPSAKPVRPAAPLEENVPF